MSKIYTYYRIKAPTIEILCDVTQSHHYTYANTAKFYAISAYGRYGEVLFAPGLMCIFFDGIYNYSFDAPSVTEGLDYWFAHVYETAAPYSSMPCAGWRK